MPTTPEHDDAVKCAATSGLVHLPAEILLHIISFLEPAETTSLQLTSKKLLDICRDNAVWKAKCFDESPFLAHYGRHQEHITNEQRATASSSHDEAVSRRKERVRIMANWDPSFPGENVNWYDEFVQRTAPVAVNWLQQPSLGDGPESTHVEARGLALYRPDGVVPHPHKLETIFAVSPLDDGSVCLWDITGAKGRKGAVYAKSRPGILFIDGPSARLDSGFTECVSVDNKLHLAFFAVQSRKSHSIASTPACMVADYKLHNTVLVDVDLRRLAVVGCESFPWSITALSSSDPCTPLTVGTYNGIHLYDFRSRPTSSADEPVRLDTWDGITAIFDTKPLPPYESLANRAPLSILHMQRPGADADMTDEVYVAGRFPSILLYDRRMFPSIKGSLHSGASLSSLASLPFPYSTLDNELRREGHMSLEQIEKSKTTPAGGRTLLACGEYKSKGSLEMYGLLPSPRLPTSLPGGLSNSVLKNRHSSSNSKLLSCVTQGTRLVVSDGSGQIKWFERDGRTEVRRVYIGHCERPHGPSVFTSVQDDDDMAMKLLPIRGDIGDRVNDNDLLFWTGEHLGMVTFTSSPGFNAESFEEKEKTDLELERERVERQYSESMREALERQADGVRFVRNLGLRV